MVLARTSLPAAEMTGPAGKLIRFMRIKGCLNSEVRIRPKLYPGKPILDPVSAVMNGEAAPPTALTKQGELDPRDWVEDKDGFDQAVAASRRSASGTGSCCWSGRGVKPFAGEHPI